MTNTPERAMWAAVLNQALSDIKYNVGGRDGIHARNSGRQWFRSKGTSINTFLGICSMLGINAQMIFEMNKHFILIDEIVEGYKITVKDHDIAALVLNPSIPSRLPPKEKRRRRMINSSISLQTAEVLNKASSLSHAARMLHIALPTLLWQINRDEKLMKIRLERFGTFKKGVYHDERRKNPEGAASFARSPGGTEDHVEIMQDAARDRAAP